MSTEAANNLVPKDKFKNPAYLYEYGLYKIPIWPVGTWPLEKPSIFKNIKFVVFFGLQIATTIILYTEVIYQCAETDVIIDYIGLGTCSALAWSKTFLVWLNNEKMLKCYDSAADDWQNTTDPKYIEIMKKETKFSRGVFLYQIITTYMSASTFLIVPIAMGVGSQVLPMQTTCTIYNLTGWHFKVVHVIQSFEIYATATGNIGHDVFLFGLIMHICGQLQILEIEFSKVGIDLKTEDSWKRIVNLIKRHQHLLALTDNLYNTTWILLFIQLVLSGYVLVILGIQILIAMNEGDYGAFGKHGLFTQVVMLQLFLHCWSGDYLESQFDKMTKALYSSVWYKVSAKLEKNIVFIMMKSNRTTQLKAGYMFEINMITFASILKLMMSMFSIIRLMFSKEE